MNERLLISKLRQRAALCRERTHGPCSGVFAQQLEATALDYEADADMLGRHMVRHRLEFSGYSDEGRT